MATNYNNIDRAAVNIILLEMLEEIMVNKMEGTYADETDECLVRLAAPLLSAIDTVPTTACGDVQTPESEPEGRNRLLEAQMKKSWPRTSRRVSPRTAMRIPFYVQKTSRRKKSSRPGERLY